MRAANNTPALSLTPATISAVRAIAMILAHGVLRHQNLESQLDNSGKESVHGVVLTTKGETT